MPEVDAREVQLRELAEQGGYVLRKGTSGGYVVFDTHQYDGTIRMMPMRDLDEVERLVTPTSLDELMSVLG